MFEGPALGGAFLDALDAHSGRWVDDDADDELHQWLSAQQVAAVLTEADLDPADTGLWHEDPDTGRQSLNYGELIPVLIQARHEDRAEVAQLRNELADLRAIVDELKEAIA